MSAAIALRGRAAVWLLLLLGACSRPRSSVTVDAAAPPLPVPRVAPAPAPAPVPLDASARGPEAVTDAATQDALDASSGPPVRWLPTRAWSAPDAGGSAASARDGGAPSGGARAQLVLTAAGPVGVSTWWDESERRHPLLARRYNAAGEPQEGARVLGYYTGTLSAVAASARGPYLWVLWRADAEDEEGGSEAKHLALRAELDLARATLPFMVRQRRQQGNTGDSAMVAIEAREDGGAWAYLSLGMRPARDVDPILRTSEDQSFQELVSEGVELDPWHRVRSLDHSVTVLDDGRCADAQQQHALFFRMGGLVFGNFVVDCAVQYGGGPATSSERGLQWSDPSPRLPLRREGTQFVSDERAYTLSRVVGRWQLQEHLFRRGVGDGGAAFRGPPFQALREPPTVRCEGGELYLASAQLPQRLQLTGPRASVDLAMLLGLLGALPGRVNPGTAAWSGSHLLYLPDDGAFLAPRARRWRCEAGSLVEDAAP